MGTLVGLTGVGGGSLMTPLLILLLGVKPSLAIGTDLLYGALTKSVGAWRHWKLGNVDLRLSAWLALGSVPGSLIGAALADWLHQHGPQHLETSLLRALACTLMLVSLSMVLGRFDASPIERPLTTSGRLGAVAVGSVVGLVLSLTSVGSGALIGLALIAVYRLSPRRVVGTDVFHAAGLLWVAGLAHLHLGNVDLRLMAALLLGSLPGVWVGSGLTHRLPSPALRLTIALVLLASSLALLGKAGLPIPPIMILVVPALVGFALHGRYRKVACPVPQTED